MDYIEKKKLWDEVQHMPFYDNRDRDAIEDLILSIPCVNTATTIETLLAEREAAVKMLHGECHACKHNAGWHNVGKCCTCQYETAKNLSINEQRYDNWQWRGPTPPDRQQAES